MSCPSLLPRDPSLHGPATGLALLFSAKGFPQLCELLGRPGLCGMSSTPELCCGDRRRAATVPEIPHNPRCLPRAFSVGAGGRGDQRKIWSLHRAVWGAVLCLALLRALQLLCCTLALSRGRFKQV